MGLSASAPTYPTNYFKSQSLSFVYGSLNIILPADFNLELGIAGAESNQHLDLRCRMKYMGQFRPDEEFIFDVPCQWNGNEITGETTLVNGQSFSINVSPCKFGNKLIFNGHYASRSPFDQGILHYEMDWTDK